MSFFPQPFAKGCTPLWGAVSSGGASKFTKRMNKIVWCAMFSKDACQTLNSSCNDEKRKNLLLGVVKAVLWGTGAAVGLDRGCVLQPRLRGRRRAAPPPPAPRRRPLNTCYLFKRPLVSSCFAKPRTPFGEVEPKLGCGRLTGGCLWRRRDKWKVRAGRKGCGRNRNSARIV